MLKWLIFAFLLLILHTTTALPEYHQNDYDVKFERVEIVWYKPTFAKDVKFNYVFYNRTQKVFNGSAHLLEDISKNITGSLQLYKFLSNEYRFFPVTVSTNLCGEYDRNNFNIRDILKNISNVHACPAKKGYYYVSNLVFDFTRFPPFIPRGMYKGEGKLYHKAEFVGEAHFYFSVLDKPLKWQ